MEVNSSTILVLFGSNQFMLCPLAMSFFQRLCSTSFPPVSLKKSESQSAQSCPTLCDPMDYTTFGILQARVLEWVAFPSPGDLPNPGIKPRSPTLQEDSLPTESQGKPMNTGMASLSLLQQVFLTQGLNQGLLHCRRIVYQLSYQGSLITASNWRVMSLPWQKACPYF